MRSIIRNSVIIITLLLLVGVSVTGWAEETKNKNETRLVPLDATEEHLRELFPVPDQWNEWYKLEEGGKLPSNITIKEFNFDNLSREHKSPKSHIINWYVNKRISQCEITKRSFPAMVDYIKKSTKRYGWKEDTKDYQYVETYFSSFGTICCSDVAEYYLSRLDTVTVDFDRLKEYLNYYSQTITNFSHIPFYFKSDLDRLKRGKPILWSLFENAEKQYPNHSGYVRKSIIIILYQLGEDKGLLLKKMKLINWKKYGCENCNLSPFFNPQVSYIDIPNTKIIEYTDMDSIPILKKYIQNSLDITELNNMYKQIIDLGLYHLFAIELNHYIRNNLSNYHVGSLVKYIYTKKSSILDEKLLSTLKYIIERQDQLDRRIWTNEVLEQIINKIKVTPAGSECLNP